MSWIVFTLMLVATLAGHDDQGARTGYQSSVAGRVIEALLSEPLRDVPLTLSSTPQGLGAKTYFTRTDKDGRFEFTGLPPGQYQLSGEKSNYLKQAYSVRGTGPPTPITLKGGEHLKDIVYILTPQAVIAGRVQNTEGDYIQDAMITLMRYSVVRGNRVLMPVAGNSSDDQGQYRIPNIAPGQYYLIARPGQPPIVTDGRQDSKPSQPTEGFELTFYPGVSDAREATAIDVRPGAELRNIDFLLRPVPLYSVSGKILGPKGPLTNVLVDLRPRDTPLGAGVPRHVGMISNAGGFFEMLNVAPGRYLLVVNQSSLGLMGELPVEVRDSSLTGLSIQVAEGAVVKGVVHLETDESQHPPPTITIGLSSGVGFSYEAIQGTVASDGRFEIRSVPSGAYHARLISPAATMFIKSVRVGEQDVTDSDLEINGKDTELTIVISTRVAVLEGTAENEKGQPMPGVIVTADRTPRQQSDPVNLATTDQNGHFLLTGMKPGRYYVLAWEQVDDAFVLDPEWRAKFQDRAASVTLRERSHVSRNISVIPRRISDAP